MSLSRQVWPANFDAPSSCVFCPFSVRRGRRNKAGIMKQGHPVTPIKYARYTRYLLYTKGTPGTVEIYIYEFNKWKHVKIPDKI